MSQYEDSRIHYVRLQENGGISENTNQALAYATGDYCGLVDHDDILTPDALYEMARAITEAVSEGEEARTAFILMKINATHRAIISMIPILSRTLTWICF